MPRKAERVPCQRAFPINFVLCFLVNGVRGDFMFVGVEKANKPSRRLAKTKERLFHFWASTKKNPTSFWFSTFRVLCFFYIRRCWLFCTLDNWSPIFSKRPVGGKVIFMNVMPVEMKFGSGLLWHVSRKKVGRTGCVLRELPIGNQPGKSLARVGTNTHHVHVHTY